MRHLQQTLTVVAVLALSCTSSLGQGWCARFTDEFIRRIHLYSAERIQGFDLDGPGGAEPVLYFMSGGQLYFWNGMSLRPLGFIGNSEPPGTGASLYEWAEFDFDADGPERPKLVLSGHFTRLGRSSTDPGVIATTGIGTFDGTDYGRLGNGLPNPVNSVAVHKDGLGESLYAATSDTIWRWNGTEFVLSWVVNGWVTFLVSFDPDETGPLPASLYAAGYFTSISGSPAKYFARWDGQTWTQVVSEQQGMPLLARVLDLDSDGPDPARLLATFWHTDQGVLYDSLDSFDGDSWTPLLSGGSRITTFTTLDEDASGPAPPRIFASPVNFSYPASGPSAVGRWDGSEWSEVGSIPSNVYLSSGLAAYDFDGSGPRSTTMMALGDPVIEWNGDRWAPFHTAPDGAVTKLKVLDADGSGPERPLLFAGGGFRSIAGEFASGFALYDGHSWIGNDNPRIQSAFSAEFFDPDGSGPQQPLLVVSAITDRYDNPTVSVWDGSQWSIDAIGPFLNNENRPAGAGVFRQAASETGNASDRLIFYGSFSRAGGVSANRIVSWNGTEFKALGLGIGSDDPANGVQAITSFDPDGPGGLLPRIVAAGTFSLAGGAPATNIAKWDGQSWSPLGLGLDTHPWYPAVRSYVTALQVFDEDGTGPSLPALFATGSFSKSGETVVTLFAKWDGLQWSAAGGGVHGSEGRALTVFDEDGSGPDKPAITISGTFNYVGESRARFNHVARWDGQSWCTPGRGYDSSIIALAAFDRDSDGIEPPSLYLGGHLFGDVGPAGQVLFLNRWGCDGRLPRVCIGDANQDSQIDMRDVAQALVSWGNTYSPLSCYGEGDANRDGRVEFSDFTAILANFGGGCSSVPGADPP